MEYALWIEMKLICGGLTSAVTSERKDEKVQKKRIELLELSDNSRPTCSMASPSLPVAAPHAHENDVH